MSERSINNRERFEQPPAPAEHLALPDAEHAEPLRPGEPDPVKRQEQARSIIEQESESKENPLQALQSETTDSRPPESGYINRSLQKITLHRELQHIRRRLPAPERLLSRVIHQPAVRVASDVAGKSISRPSGLLGGGIIAFAGTLGYMYTARHIGFQYNYVVFTLLFLGGFVVGLGLELLIWTVSRSRRAAE